MPARFEKQPNPFRNTIEAIRRRSTTGKARQSPAGISQTKKAKGAPPEFRQGLIGMKAEYLESAEFETELEEVVKNYHKALQAEDQAQNQTQNPEVEEVMDNVTTALTRQAPSSKHGNDQAIHLPEGHRSGGFHFSATLQSPGPQPIPERSLPY